MKWVLDDYVFLLDTSRVNENKAQKPPPDSKAVPKDYTLELPMFDLGEAIKLVTEIQEKALETATMVNVAKGCGYASPSSTPFYRRVVASRLFKLLAQEGANLTTQALDYLKPSTEDAKAAALKNSILGISAYEELVQSHQGKRLNVEIIANGLARRFGLTQAAATICAKTFTGSLKFAGFLDVDGSLKRILATEDKTVLVSTPILPSSANRASDEAPGTKTYELVLDKENRRSVKVNAPLDITQKEVQRISKWLEVQLLIDDFLDKP